MQQCLLSTNLNWTKNFSFFSCQTSSGSFSCFLSNRRRKMQKESYDEEGRSLLDFSLDLLPEEEVHTVPFLCPAHETCMGNFPSPRIFFCTHDASHVKGELFPAKMWVKQVSSLFAQISPSMSSSPRIAAYGKRSTFPENSFKSSIKTSLNLSSFNAIFPSHDLIKFLQSTSERSLPSNSIKN